MSSAASRPDWTSDPPAPTRLCQAQNLGQGPNGGDVGGSLVAGFGNASEVQIEWAVPTHRDYIVTLNAGYTGHMTWNYLTPSDGKVHVYDAALNLPIQKDGQNFVLDWSDPKTSAQQGDEIYRGVASTFAPDVYDNAAPGVTLVDTGTGFVRPAGNGSYEIGMRPVSFYIVFLPTTLGATYGISIQYMYAYNIKYAPYSGAVSNFKMYDPTSIANAQPFASALIGNGGPNGAPMPCSFGMGDTFENLLTNCIDVFQGKGGPNDPNVVAEAKVLGDLLPRRPELLVPGRRHQSELSSRPGSTSATRPRTAAGLNCGIGTSKTSSTTQIR